METKHQLLKVYSKPQLKEPFLVAAGPSTANVALRVASYLKEKLEGELFAEIEPGDFFEPPYGLTFQDGLIELAPLEFGKEAPQNKFYYWKSGGEHDLILFLGNAHPLPGKGRELASYVLDVARSFNVTRLFTPGAFLVDVHHLDEPVIYGVATNKKMLAYLDNHDIPPSPPMNIAYNLITWLLGTAREKEFDGVGLVSEIPFYNADGSNIRACRALVTVLRRMLGLRQVDLTDLDYLLIEEEAQIEQHLGELRESADERAAYFLQYIEQLKERGERGLSGREIQFPIQEELPQSLRYIEELYVQVKEDKSKAPAFRAELSKLGNFDRLLVLRKYGNELLKLLDWQI